MEKINGNDGNDWPTHEQNSTEYSSIGPTWPPRETSFNRIKGFYNEMIYNLSQFQLFFDAFSNFLYSNGFGKDFTRVSLRAVLKKDLLINLPDEYRPYVEAIIPLKDTQPEFQDYCLVYFGYNHESRTSRHSLEEDKKNLNLALQEKPINPKEIIDNAIKQGYEIRILAPEDITNETVRQVHSLIARFGYDLTTTEEMLKDPNFTFAIAIKDGRIISVSVAEKLTITISNIPLVLVELTEAATDRGHLKRGLYAAASTKILIELARRVNNGEDYIDIIFGECNGAALGVLKTAVRQGRIFSAQVGEIYDYPYSGCLPKHVPILSPDEDISDELTNYNNLFPAFITKKDLERIFLFKN